MQEESRMSWGRTRVASVALGPASAMNIQFHPTNLPLPSFPQEDIYWNSGRASPKMKRKTSFKQNEEWTAQIFPPLKNSPGADSAVGREPLAIRLFRDRLSGRVLPCPVPSQSGPHWPSQPNLGQLWRATLARKIYMGHQGCHWACITYQCFPLPSLASFPCLPQVLIPTTLLHKHSAH